MTIFPIFFAILFDLGKCQKEVSSHLVRGRVEKTGTAEIDVEVNVVSSGAVVAESAKEVRKKLGIPSLKLTACT